MNLVKILYPQDRDRSSKVYAGRVRRHSQTVGDELVDRVEQADIVVIYCDQRIDYQMNLSIAEAERLGKQIVYRGLFAEGFRLARQLNQAIEEQRVAEEYRQSLIASQGPA